MSGHSKWSTIKRQKGAADIKRGQMFTKLANAIIIAVRESGGITDPVSNFKLRLAIEKARQFNMPKENIDRALQRAAGKEKGEDIKEVVYEGFGPGGIGIIIECATDNKQRTFSEVKNLLEKNGGTLGQKGAVSYQFKQVGIVTVKKNGKTSEEILSIAADSGAQDLEEVDEEVLIYTDPASLKTTKEEFEKQGLIVSEAQLSQNPKILVSVKDKETSGKILSLIDKLENLDDVQKVYSNFDISDEFL